MAELAEQKRKLIEDIIRLQDDFQVLTDRSNALQHQNEYYTAQLQDLQQQVQTKRLLTNSNNSNNKSDTNSIPLQKQPQWPMYIKIEGDLPQQPGQYIKFVGEDGRYYIQNLQLVQYVEQAVDGKSQQIVKQQYMVVQQPLEMFQLNHGKFQEFGLQIGQQNTQQNTKTQEKKQEKVQQQSEKQQTNQNKVQEPHHENNKNANDKEKSKQNI